MESAKELGIKISAKFLFYSLIELIYSILFLPPLRVVFLRILGAKIGKGTVIMKVTFFNWHRGGPPCLKIGKESFIGDKSLIDLYDSVTIEDQVTIAQRVTILTHLNVGYKNHPLQSFFPKKSKGVIFKSGSVIAACSTILPGVIINKNSFVAAGSVVTKDVPPNTLVAGVPAKVVRKIK